MRILLAACIALLVSETRCSAKGESGDEAALGCAVGEVTESTAVLWARCSHAARLVVRLRREGEEREKTERVPVAAARDFTGRVQLKDLQASTTYRYEADCADGRSHSLGSAGEGSFTTAPADDVAQPVRFAWSGDLGGQNVCRDAQFGYDIFDRVREQKPAFFIALGDMIYADDPCKAVGRYGNAQLPNLPVAATRTEEFWAVWRYNRGDEAFRRFLAAVPIFPVWDDHEILNDAGPHRDTLPVARGRHLLPIALQAFLDYQPLLPPPSAPKQLYRRRRWGRHLELFLLDLRQYRDLNSRADDGRQPKTMLGDRQRQWLLDALRQSTATWKVVISSVPISIPTSDDERGGHDGWTSFGGRTGFKRELLDVLRALERQGTRNLVWLTTDVHFAAAFSYVPFADNPSFEFHEFVSGPLNAGMFPKQEYDDTFGAKRLFLYGPPKPAEIPSFTEAKEWFNFGVVDADAEGALTVRIVNDKGAAVAEQRLMPQ